MTEIQEWGVKKNLSSIVRRPDSVFELTSRVPRHHPEIVAPGDADYEFLVRASNLKPGERWNIHYDLSKFLKD